MTVKEKSHTYASVGTVLVLLLLFLILWLIRFKDPMQQDPEEIEVALQYGDSEDGGGSPGRTGSTPAVVVPPVPTPPAPTPAEPTPPVMTQDDPETVAIPEQPVVKKEPTKTPEQIEQERQEKLRQEELRRQEEERRQQEAREAEKRRKEEEKRKQEEAKRAAAADLVGGAMFGGDSGSGQGGPGSGKGSGDGTTDGHKGLPDGWASFGNGNGGYQLNGRSCLKEQSPKNTHNQEGVVVVEIRVNAEGRVTSAKQTTGTTISDPTTVNLAIEAAKQTQWSKSSSPEQVGKLRYFFTFN